MSAFTNARAIERLEGQIGTLGALLAELGAEVKALADHVGYFPLEQPAEVLAKPPQAPSLEYWVKFFGKDRYNVLDRENAKQSRQWLSKDQAQDLCDKLNTEQAARRVA